jgi:non-haem Fe2+, alpha-ketoglutarate-dependent halogenase
MMTNGISLESYRTRFEKEGVVYPVRVLTAEKASHYLECFEEIEDILGWPLKRMGNPALFFSWAFALATEPRVLDAVEAILGHDLLISGTLIFCKYPRDPAFVAWHQDTVYSNLHLTPSVSAWIALLDSTPDNGCMRVVPGSHLYGTLPHQEVHDSANLLKRGEEIQVDISESDAIDLALNAGEMSLHHHAIVHGSGPNRSDTKRLGFIVRFVTPEYNVGPQRTPFLRARGDFDGGHLEIAEQPTDRDIREALAAWRNSNSG